jgi:cytochrome c
MKKWIAAAAAALFLAPAALAADGKALFEANGCTACHTPDKDTVGPSLMKIAQEYKGKKEELGKFLQGTAKPIVDPAGFAMMKPNLTKTQALSKEELASLADFLLGVMKK